MFVPLTRLSNCTFVFLTLCLTLSFSTQAIEESTVQSNHQHRDTLPTSMGLHGMLLFGSEDGLFASHLPMYHAPHNAQVVFKLHFEDAAIQTKVTQALVATRANPIWTIVPQKFDLARLAPDNHNPLTTFNVDIVEGHFERGGNPRWHNQTLIVDKILIFTPLDMREGLTKPTHLHYQLIRSTTEDTTQFLVKKLNVRPDADHIIKLSNLNDSLPHIVSFTADSRPYSDVEQIKTQLNVSNVKPLYLELNELQ
ncbi:hypothetical protein [Shewanella subflava]|uniref:Uncharacterized protein n=1 Tax=Shewanella subflava TaxID=2986476 RepID=A0ABT3I872_9GAMM|nr:hypothetical protein [Shewanella subflava]MCW3172197.1 hypothetical protein [Shewanella subflava]